uniref:Uncharacterized protein n=1 Tax=Oryzias latipes TaxID=8090 RepID=A0A3P9K3H7_ORYLA
SCGRDFWRGAVTVRRFPFLQQKASSHTRAHSECVINTVIGEEKIMGDNQFLKLDMHFIFFFFFFNLSSDM